jgi:rare lipoprotein A (peptidoglycan hydrolase)
MNSHTSSLFTFTLVALLSIFYVVHAIQVKAVRKFASDGNEQYSGGYKLANSPAPGAKGGKASFYTEWKSNPGSCGAIPTDPNLCAIHPSFMPASCGKCILVTYNDKTLKVKVTDTCPGCSLDKIDLSDEAFAKLASKDAGIINIKWDWTAC